MVTLGVFCVLFVLLWVDQGVDFAKGVSSWFDEGE